ncbi:hypothetical protein AtDm6_0959 [Acetobacter tropicalis]|uniref:Uncharacterized protein n=1 Tax=Acetobacter tropicalis TaxID=104102 RepID=A0A094YS55_9PROT|nr:hypothetical protein AtDm6_0959 [Acetobacter tropicalis]
MIVASSFNEVDRPRMTHLTVTVALVPSPERTDHDIPYHWY